MEDLISHIKIYCKATVINKTVSNRNKNTHINSREGTENLKIDSCIYGHLIYVTKMAQQSNRFKTTLSINNAGSMRWSLWWEKINQTLPQQIRGQLWNGEENQCVCPPPICVFFTPSTRMQTLFSRNLQINIIVHLFFKWCFPSSTH